VPRLTAAYWLDDLAPDSPLPITAMLAGVQALAPAPYTAVGMNLYRDGRDSVATHPDKLRMLVPGRPLALVSLGHPRRMRIRAQADHRDAFDVELAHGSLLLMSHASQLSHEHGIPTTTKPVGPRMSVVFRARPPRRPQQPARPECNATQAGQGCAERSPSPASQEKGWFRMERQGPDGEALLPFTGEGARRADEGARAQRSVPLIFAWEAQQQLAALAPSSGAARHLLP